MRFLRSAIENKWTLLFCFFGFVINFSTFYPGFMSPDSIDQYTQALNGQYSTWHPPVMAFVWHVLNYIYSGPQVMLFLQLSFLWLSCYLFSVSMQSTGWRICIFLIFFTAPFIQNFTGWIVKDTQMAVSWLLAIAILFKKLNDGDDGSKFFPGVFSALLLLYGTLLRHNAVTALFPLCALWAWIIFKRGKIATRLLYSIALFLLIALSHNFFEVTVLNARQEHPEGQLYFHDLNDFFVKTHKNVYPAVMYKNPDFDTAYIRDHYDPADVTSIFWNADKKNIISETTLDKNTTDELQKALVHAVKDSPILYLKNRWEIYLYFLMIKKESRLHYMYYFAWMQPNNFGLKINENFLYVLYCKYMGNSEHKIYFQVWFWIFLNVVLFPAGIFIKNYSYKFFYMCIIFSGFLYTLPQFIISNLVADFRYIYWSCFTCTVAVLVIIADRLRRVV